MERKQKSEKLGRVVRGSVAGTVDAVSTALNVTGPEARRVLARFLGRLRK